MAKKDIPLADDNLQRTSVGQIRRKLLRYSIIATAVGQVLIIIITAILYTLFDGMNSYLAFIITMTSIIVFEVVIMLVVVDLLIYPLDIIARTVSSIIGEKPTVYPPNPNRLRGPARMEVAKAVDFLYTKESIPITPTNKQPDEAGQVALNLVHSLPVGLIALDYDFNILAFNVFNWIFATVDSRWNNGSIRFATRQSQHHKPGLEFRMFHQAALRPVIFMM